MAVYWVAFALFAYGTVETTTGGPITRLPLLFAGVSVAALVGLWQLRTRTWGVTLIWWALFLVLWPLAVYASSHFPVSDASWVFPVPAFLWFVYRQHDLYLDN
ncbi:hypothetical protein BRD15_08250 [Halobacteriales archaeon SW_6_65_15]|jgi:peptidoglycan/LPS O-acetylase OafA/YrhL|nr:MAG: hypothetical protein BRD15_08250 [Halobacteriales archaeon SW_6_65_15]